MFGGSLHARLFNTSKLRSKAYQIYTRCTCITAAVKHAHTIHFNHPTRLEMLAQRMENISRFLPNKLQTYTNTKRYLRGYFTKFLLDVAASSPVLMPLC